MGSHSATFHQTQVVLAEVSGFKPGLKLDFIVTLLFALIEI